MKEKRVEEIQCIDYFLGQEIASGWITNLPRFKNYGYAGRIVKKVAKEGYLITAQDVKRRKSKVCREGHVLKPASFFSGKPMSRIGKDQNYHHLFSLWDQWVAPEDRRYIGLPANQIDLIASHMERPPMFAGPNLVACELNKTRYKHMEGLVHNLVHKRPGGPTVNVVNENVFDAMEGIGVGRFNFNFIDLDLMVALPEQKELTYWAKLIYQCASDLTAVILHIAALTARVSDKVTHSQRLKCLYGALEHAGFTIVGRPTHFAYTDSEMPMGCLRVVLRKGRRNQ